MPIFQYTARNEDGLLVSDKVAFHDEGALRTYLRKNNLFVLSLAEQNRSRFQYDRRVRLSDLIVMSRQLSTMVLVGLPLVSGLEALAQQTVNSRLASVLKQVARSVTTGRPLASALADHPAMFPEMLITLIRAGEMSGRLTESLQEASRQMELQLEIRQKTMSALMYPVFTLCATVLTVGVMIVWIVPVFAKIYQDLHATLPPPTLFLVWFSSVIVHNVLFVLAGIIAAFAAIRRYYKTPEGRYKIDDFKLRMPLFGQLVLKAGSGNLMGSLAGLLDSGVPLLQAMRTSARVTGNAVLVRAINEAAEHVGAGRKFSDELERSERFPVMVVRMIAMAESTGNLPEVLRQIANAYMEEVQYAIRRVLVIVEPLLVLVVALVVGFVLICLYYPIFNLGNVFLKGG